jgi:death-on-curing protein
MRQEPKWLSIIQVRMLHAESIQLFGGSPGIRDVALLESALDRAKNKWHYDETVSLFELAAAYGFGIAKNHPFVDGDKRTSLLAIRSFLFINGYHFNPEEVETVTVIEGMEAGRVDEMQLADWIEANCSPRDKR